MEILIHILIISIFINTILKISFWKAKFQILFAISVAVFILSVYPTAIEQSQTELTQWLESTNTLSTIAILTTLEALLYINFCFLSLKEVYKQYKVRLLLVLKMYAGILIFPASFYITIQSMFLFTGFDFLRIALSLAFLVILIIPTICYVIRWILPEKELRLEVLFLMSLLVTGLGLISTANGNIVYIPKKQPIDYLSLLYIIGIVAIFFIVGLIGNHLKWKILSNKRTKRHHKN